MGRLDKDSEGLLLLTNDSSLNQRLLHPDQKFLKCYSCQLEGDPESSHLLDVLLKSVPIRVQGKLHQAKAEKVHYLKDPPTFPEREPPVRFRKNVPDFWVEICLTEGKNRQIRRMCAAAGFPVLRLIRTKVGPISLEGLEPGQIKPIKKSDLFE